MLILTCIRIRYHSKSLKIPTICLKLIHVNTPEPETTESFSDRNFFVVHYRRSCRKLFTFSSSSFSSSSSSSSSSSPLVIFNQTWHKASLDEGNTSLFKRNTSLFKRRAIPFSKRREHAK